MQRSSLVLDTLSLLTNSTTLYFERVGTSSTSPATDTFSFRLVLLSSGDLL